MRAARWNPWLPVAGAVFLLSLPGPGAGQGLTVGVAPEASRIYWDDALGLEDATFFGGEATLGFGRFVLLRGAYGQAGGLTLSPLAGAGDEQAGRLDARHFSTDVLFRLGPWRLAPVLAGGGGVLELDPESGEAGRHVSLAYGGGLDARVLPWLTARALVRDLRFRVDRSALLPGVVLDPEREALRSSPAVTVGLGARLGGGDSGAAEALDREMESLYRGRPEGLMIPVELYAGAVRFDDQLGLGDRRLVGVRTGFDFGPWFGIRGVVWQGVAEEYDGFEGTRGWSGEAQFSVGRVTRASPFLLLGFGHLDFSDEGEGAPPDQSALIAGAGFGYPLGDRSRITVALRDFVTSAGALADVSGTSELRHSLALSAGLSYRVLGRRQPGPARPEPGEVSDPEDERVVVGEDAGAGPDTVTALRLRADSLGAVADTAVRNYQSDRMMTVPIPREGEVYLRYGPGGIRDGGRSVPDSLRLLLDSLRSERPGQAGEALPEGGRLTEADFALLEARLVARLAAAAEADRTAEIQALRRQVEELARLVREGFVATSGGGAGAPDRPLLHTAALQIGASGVEESSTGVGATLGLELARGPARVRPYLGLGVARADVATTVDGSSVFGSVTNVEGRLGATVALPRVGPVEPYLTGFLSATGGPVDGDTDQDDELLGRVYDDVAWGPGAGVAVAWRPDGWRRLSARAVLTRTWAGSRAGWFSGLGIGWTPGRTSGRGGPEGAPFPADAVEGAPEDTAAGLPPGILERFDALEAALEAETEARRRSEEEVRAARARADSLLAVERRAREVVEAAAAEELVEEEVETEVPPGLDPEVREGLDVRLGELVGVFPDVLAVRPSALGLEIVMGGDVFASGSAALRPGARSQLTSLAEILGAALEGTAGRIVVEGHTDAVGSEDENLVLSRLRAETVRGVLAAGGVDPSRVAVVGMGESAPIADNGTTEGRSRNRRVEIVVR